MAPAFLGDRSAMSRISRDQIRKQLDEAEGYLMLDLPRRSLQILDSRPDWSTMQFEASFLKGEALRSLNRYREALKPLEIAASLRPSDTRVALALGWCYKRTNRLAQAIDSLDRALREPIPTSRCCTTTWPATGAWPATAPRRSTRSPPRWNSIPISARSSPRSGLRPAPGQSGIRSPGPGPRAADLIGPRRHTAVRCESRLGARASSRTVRDFPERPRRSSGPVARARSDRAVRPRRGFAG